MLCYVETDFGCGIRQAKSLKSAWDTLLQEEGSDHAQTVRLATKEDIQNVRVMGGYIPEDR